MISLDVVSLLSARQQLQTLKKFKQNLFQKMKSPDDDEAMEVEEATEATDVKAEVKVAGILIGASLICNLTAENPGRSKKVKTSNRIPILCN